MDVLGFANNEFTAEQREAVLAAHPRGTSFKNIIDAFYEGMKHRPDSTFGTVNDDVLALDSQFKRTDFCQVIFEVRVGELTGPRGTLFRGARR